jgi:hypothetical protein
MKRPDEIHVIYAFRVFGEIRERHSPAFILVSVSFLKSSGYRVA